MTVGETFTWLRRTGPFGRIAPHLSPRALTAIVFALAVLFPIIHPNDAEIGRASCRERV